MGVVVPAYGVERWLDECIDSLLRQTHRRWEAVIVDDGSTDATGEKADSWAVLRRTSARPRHTLTSVTEWSAAAHMYEIQSVAIT